MRKGAKRKTKHKSEPPKKPSAEEQINEPSQSPSQPAEENHLEERKETAKPEPSEKAGRRKRAKISKPVTEPEYFPERRNLDLELKISNDFILVIHRNGEKIVEEDLWQQVFPVGTEWDQLEMVYQYKWNFSNLEDALEEGGELYNEKVYLFGCTEAPMVPFQGQFKPMLIPIVVAVVSPFPPSDKIGIKSVQRETEEIVPMKHMKMDWVPYIPLEKRASQVERLKNSQIFILSCIQRRAGLKHLKLERVKKFDYCLPYFYNPLQEDELEQSTVVDIMFPIDSKPVVCEFDWELDELEEFVDEISKSEELSEDQKEPFKDFVKQKVREAKRANREAREARRKTVAEMSEETRAAFQNMRFYKFYPVSTPDTPDVSNWKDPFINRYYGKAHKVL